MADAARSRLIGGQTRPRSLPGGADPAPHACTRRCSARVTSRKQVPRTVVPVSLPLLGSTGPVATHCPYCSLQCGMTVGTRAAADGGGYDVEGLNFPTNRGGLCEKGLSAAELLTHPDRLTSPLVRDTRDEPFREATWDEALDRVAAGIRATQERYGRDSAGLFGGGGMTNEKAYQAGKFVRVALRSAATSTTTAGSACPRPPTPRCAPSGSTAACRSPSPTSPAPTPCCSSGATRPTYAPGHAVVRRAVASAAATHSSSTRATPPAPPRPTSTSSRSPAPTSRCQRPAAPRDQHRLVDTAYIAERTTGSARGAPRDTPVLAGPGRADHRRAGARAGARGCASLAASRATMILSGRGAEQHSKGSTPPWPGSTWRWPSGSPAGPVPAGPR